jgi:hypothetical protein
VLPWQSYGHAVTWTQAGFALFTFAIVCEHGHVVSPIVLAWSHPGLRKIALERPIETMLLPVLAICCMLMLPMWWAGAIYWPWNIYHFGAQHYGVGRLLGWRTSRWWCVGVTAAIMAGGPLLIHDEWMRWFFLFAIDFNHWLVDIGLSSRVSRRWWLFLAAVAALGCIGFTFQAPRTDHNATRAIPWVIQARWGVGIAHFLYSRWVWKLSDPRVRATIGKDLWRTA